MKSRKPLSEPSDVLYRIKRGLSGYVSYHLVKAVDRLRKPRPTESPDPSAIVPEPPQEDL